MLADLCPCFHRLAKKIVPKSCFVHVLDCARILGARGDFPVHIRDHLNINSHLQKVNPVGKLRRLLVDLCKTADYCYYR